MLEHQCSDRFLSKRQHVEDEEGDRRRNKISDRQKTKSRKAVLRAYPYLEKSRVEDILFKMEQSKEDQNKVTPTTPL